MGSGIYTIHNKLNDSLYIGSAINIASRYKNHFSKLKANSHPNKRLQLAYNKYGKDNFEMTSLQFVYNPKDLIKQEQYWMDVARHEEGRLYNYRLIAENNLGWKQSKETIEKRKHTNKINGYNYGRGIPKSPEMIAKMISAKTGKMHPRKGDFYTKICKKGHNKTLYPNGKMRCKVCRCIQMRFYNTLGSYIKKGG